MIDVWRRKRGVRAVEDQSAVTAADADAALERAEASLVRAEVGRKERAPIYAEAERHIARNGIYDDLMRSLQLKGSS